jgi:Uroporphyrinogen decarboxylase (URO-D)
MLNSFLSLLNGQPASDIVWTADISYWIAGQRYAGAADPAWDTEEGYLALCHELGILPYYWYDRFWLGEPVYDASVSVVTESRGDARARRWRTRLGELREETTFLPQSCSVGCTRYPVQSEADLRNLLYLVEHRRMAPANLDDYYARKAVWARAGGLPSIALPRSPLAAFLYEWAGVENGIYLITDCPDLVRQLFAMMEAQEAPILAAVSEVAPPLVHFADNLSSDNLAGYYDRFMAGPHRRRLEKLHAAGVACAVHLDGTVAGLLPKLAAVGFDAIEALTPFPAGDLRVEEMRAAAGNDAVVLWGGVPGVMFSPPFTWQDMEGHVRRLLDAWRGERFIVGVADQVPPDGNIDYCRRIAELIRDAR